MKPSWGAAQLFLPERFKANAHKCPGWGGCFQHWRTAPTQTCLRSPASYAARGRVLPSTTLQPSLTSNLAYPSFDIHFTPQ